MEINPQNNILPEYPQSNLDPCLSIHRPPYYQSVYSCSSYPVEPYQQNYPWQAYYNYSMQLDSATIYNLEIISGSEYAYFYKVGHWDTTTHAPVDEEYIGSTLNGLTGVELAGWGRYEAFHWSGTFEREHWTYYHIKYQNFSEFEANVIFKITNLSTNEFTEWHTTIVNPQYVLENIQINGDTVLHKRGFDVTPRIRNVLSFTCHQFGYGSCPPENVTFGVEILEGQEYGTIGRYNREYETWDYSDSFQNLSYDDIFGNYLFNYQATEQQPDSTSIVKIKQYSSDADIGSIDYSFYVKRNFLPPVSENGSIIIVTNKPTAVAGDTLDVSLLWLDGSNGIVNFTNWQTFEVYFADGFDYGTILNTSTGDTSDSFTEIGQNFKLIINSDVTESNAKIIIAAETKVAMLGGRTALQSNSNKTITDKKKEENQTVERNISSKNDDEIIQPDFIVSEVYLSGIKEIIVNPFIIEIDPPVISAGDTAKIIPKYIDENGNYVEYPADQTFELGMLDGCVLGKLSNAGIDTNYFYGVTQPFYFIADSSADSGVVSIRVGVIEMNQQNRSLTNNNNNTPESDNPVSCANVSFVENLYANANLPVEKKYEILLGETKWYQVKYTDLPESKLVIDELSGPYYWPDRGEPIKQDVWGDNPVSIVEGDKLGVYWETQKPVWEGNVKKGNLPIGLIRLIGRYWEEGKTYKVKLTARTQNGDEANIEIEVMKPTKLGTEVAIVKDVSNVDLNIDKLCIEWGGKLGIPPNFIKGHMRKETSAHDPFYPTYLYEPWTTQFNSFKENKRLMDNLFFVPKDATFFDPPTPNYDNVKDFRYPLNPLFVWDMIESYSTIVHTTPPGGWRKYGERRATKNASKEDGILYFVYKTPQKIYNAYKDAAYEKHDVLNKKTNEPLANNEARENFINYIKNEWNGGITGGTKGLKNIKAQTRMTSSYGLLQILYTTAIGNIVDYPQNINNLPEELLKTENIKYALKLLNYYIDASTKNEINKNGNWKRGFEATYMTQVWHSWNPGQPEYPALVLDFANIFKPSNK